ncbi:MAG TPA: carotenoid 1,2-hydratase, partial [Deltaproteobacteria bacterium]|nr:carotenoid 1,2-hydratase [Deltaproteobacteria bacterium]
MTAVVIPVRPAGADPWKQAIAPREWHFPQDHGAHPEYRTEWWYFTGNLFGSDGHRYGYQLTFFRQGIVQDRRLPNSSWSIRDLYLAHFALTDINEGRFLVFERASRTGPGLAGSETTGLNVWLLSWSAKMKGGVIRLTAVEGDRSIELELRPRKPVVLHGKGGLSQKGTMPGQASYYASLTDLSTRGTLRVPGKEKPIQVQGVSWFDHEFGSNQLSSQQVGWDWFGLHLSDGRDLMLYLLRRQDGSVDIASGTVVEPDGQTRQVEASDIRIHVSRHWKSPKSGATYPARWTIHLSRHQVNLEVESLVADQELVTKESTGVTYWEGAVAGRGQSRGQ